MRCFVLDEDGVRCPRIVLRKTMAPLVATLVSPWGMRMIHGRMSARACVRSSSNIFPEDSGGNSGGFALVRGGQLGRGDGLCIGEASLRLESLWGMRTIHGQISA